MSKNTNTLKSAADSGIENSLVEILFDRMPMGIAILDSSFNITRYNPTWAEFAERYAPSGGSPLTPGMYYLDRFPGAESTSIPMFEKVLSGETIRGDGLL